MFILRPFVKFCWRQRPCHEEPAMLCDLCLKGHTCCTWTWCGWWGWWGAKLPPARWCNKWWFVPVLVTEATVSDKGRISCWPAPVLGVWFCWLCTGGATSYLKLSLQMIRTLWWCVLDVGCNEECFYYSGHMPYLGVLWIIYCEFRVETVLARKKKGYSAFPFECLLRALAVFVGKERVLAWLEPI
mgnify:CR=1 FL=1